eukprot:2384852-Pyramimonas_sp.AAC.1
MPVSQFASCVDAPVHPEDPEILYWQWRGLPAVSTADLGTPNQTPLARPGDPDPAAQTSKPGPSAPLLEPLDPSRGDPRKRKLEPGGVEPGAEQELISSPAARPRSPGATLEGLPRGLRSFLAGVVEPLAAPAFVAKSAVQQRSVWWGRSVTSRLHFDAM